MGVCKGKNHLLQHKEHCKVYTFLITNNITILHDCNGVKMLDLSVLRAPEFLARLRQQGWE